MLTKDLLKYSCRGGKVFPKYIKANDTNISDDCRSLMAMFSQHLVEKSSYQALNQSLEPLVNQNIVLQGMKKLLEDRSSFSDEGFETIETKRWRHIYAAQKIRTDDPSLSYQEFSERLVERTAKNSY